MNIRMIPVGEHVARKFEISNYWIDSADTWITEARNFFEKKDSSRWLNFPPPQKKTHK